MNDWPKIITDQIVVTVKSFKATANNVALLASVPRDNKLEKRLINESFVREILQ